MLVVLSHYIWGQLVMQQQITNIATMLMLNCSFCSKKRKRKEVGIEIRIQFNIFMEPNNAQVIWTSCTKIQGIS